MTRHLSPEELLRYMDGELSKSAMRRSADHLQACWSCQVEFGRLKEQIAAILDAQTIAFLPSLPPPPAGWPRLEPRLEREKDVTGGPFWRRIVQVTTTMGPQPAYVVAALLLMFIGLLVWISTPASVKEVLRRTTVADATRLAITEREVVRQRVSVKKTTRVASFQRPAKLESWKSLKSTYWNSAADPVASELQDRYRANGLAAALPLSPRALEGWLKIASAEPSSSEKGELIYVQVVSHADGRQHGLEEINFRVQRRNWHLDQMTLSFGDANYQITEEETSVLAKNEVPKDVMPFLEAAQQLSSPGTAAKLPAPNVARESAPSLDLDDLEMAVRFDLHSIGADLGESIEISTRAPNLLVVDARGVSPQMKERLTALLSNKPGVELEFQTPDGTAGSSHGVTRVLPQTDVSPGAPDDRLKAFFGSSEAQENYARSVLEASNNALEHLYALGNLARRWPDDQEIGLSETSKLRLNAMVGDHARGMLISISMMVKQLDPLLRAFGHPLNDESATSSVMKWRQATASALEVARRVDLVLRSLLTISNEPLSLENGLPLLQQDVTDLRRAARQIPAQ